MSNGNMQLEKERSAKLAELYDNLLEVIGPDFKFDRFLGWVSQYLRVSREFHGLDHLLTMSELNKDLEGRAGIYSMVAGFFHDEDYPSISEELTPISKRFIDKYVEVRDGRKYVKALEEGDVTGQILHGVFGFKPGQELLSFAMRDKEGNVVNPGGINEFYSAVGAAGELTELKASPSFITAIVAGIEATVPFRNSNRMNELKARIESTNRDVLSSSLSAKDIEEIMISAVHTANKDISGFLGGLKPGVHEHPTVSSVVNTIVGGDRLCPEEIAALRTKDKSRTTGPGNYTPQDFLAGRLKRAGLYQLVISGDDEKETIPNLFYEVTLADGHNTYPPNGDAGKSNHLAYLNNKPVKIAEYARLISAGIIYSIAAQGGEETDPKKVTLATLMTGMMERIPPQFPAPDATADMKLAFACLNGRAATQDGSDTRRSPLAEVVLAKLSEKKIEELGKLARTHLLSSPPSPTQPNPQKFLEVATEYLGSTVGKIRDEMVHSARGAQKQMAATVLAEVNLPQVIAR